MPPQDRSRRKLPNIPPPSGVVFSIASHAPLSTIYGLTDFEVIFAGTHRFDGLRMYVNEEPQGDRMTLIHRNRYIQVLDTALWVDGLHQVAFAAVNDRDEIVCSVFTDLLFRNLQNFSFIAIGPNNDRTGYLGNMRINTLRAELPNSFVEAVNYSYSDHERERLVTKLSYAGGSFNGTPIATLTAEREGGAELTRGLHRLTVTIRDNQGNPLSWMHHKLNVE